MHIPFVSLYSQEKAALVDEILSDFRKIIESSQFILGPSVEEFEKEFAKVTGCRFAVGVNSGLDAIILSMRALGIGPGDEVITAPNSFLATAAAIQLVGAKTVFVDVNEDFNIAPEKIEAAITKKTRAIMPVHLTGNPARMAEINAIAAKHKLAVIEDAAQAIGAMENGKPVGSLGTVSAFSLHPLKNLHVWGDGGMIVTDSEELTVNLKLQRNHGLKNRDEAEFFSYNSRLDTLQSVVGRHFLKLLEQTTEKRIHNANLYSSRLSHLKGKLELPSVRPGVRHVFHVFQTRATHRDALKQFLSDHGVDTKIHYPLPIHWQKAAEGLGYKKGDFPVTDRLAGEILSFPIRENLREDEILSICELVDTFYKKV